MFFLLLLVAIAALFEPHCFRFLTGQAIRFEAWRNGVSVRIGAVDGSLFEPVTLRDSVWIYESDSGPITRIEVATATAEFSWQNLLPRSSGRWFQRLTINGLSGKIQFPLEAPAPATGVLNFHLPRPEGPILNAPERIEARNVDFIFQSDRDYVHLADTEFTLSNVEAGTIRAGQILIKQPWLNRTFRNVQGTTAIQDAKVEIANLTLEPAVQMQSLTAELDDLARGRLNLEMRLAAFGGSMRVAAQTLSQERPFAFEATGTFTQIGVAKLAAFLGSSDAAGGVIKEGKFTFRGPPQQASKANASLRLEATNFQWDSRQWDTLVLGATLMDGRVQVPELALVQGHNRLNLNGEMPLPAPGTAWWQSEFSMNISARIENLTELSALMLPDFQYAAGKANIDGSIRGKDQQFHGQLIVSGTNLRWHNAPIEELHAGVNLNGNEFQLTNVSIFNNGDYLRGHGVVNIIGDKQYWGEIHASIEDLAKYSAILQKPIVPEPLAGGAIIDWSGEGSAKGHSGKFSARLRKVRSLGATAALLHPINADLDGTYAPAMMQFSRFVLSDDDSSFTANVGIGNKALSLQGIKLYHQQALWLEGDALLPLDVWNAWPNTTLATLLDDQTVSKVNLTAYNLSLKEASLLTGWKFPIEGVVLGNVVAEGPLNGLKMSGKLSLSKAQIPLGWSGEVLSGVEGEATFEGAALQIRKFSGRHPFGDFAATGQISFPTLRDPTLQLAVSSEKTDLTIFGSSHASLSGKLQIAGPCSAATVSGEARLLAFDFAARPELGLWLIEQRPLSSPSVFALSEAPWGAWQFDVAIKTPEPIPTRWNPLPMNKPSSTVEADLHLIGSGAAPQLVGSAALHNLPIDLGLASLTGEGVLNFREGFAHDPSILAEARGIAFEEPFSVQATGTMEHPMRVFVFNPPLTEKIVRAQLSAQDTVSTSEPPTPFGLHVAEELMGDVDLQDWANIPTPPPNPEPAPAVPAAPVIPAATTPAIVPPAPAAPLAPATPSAQATPVPAAPAASTPAPTTNQ